MGMFENPEGDIFKYEYARPIDLARVCPPPGGPSDLSRLLHCMNNEILINKSRTLVDAHLFVLVKCLKLIQMQERFNQEEHYIAKLLEKNVYSLEILSSSDANAAFTLRHVGDSVKVSLTPVGSELDNNYVREVYLNNQKYDVEWVDPNLIKNLTPSQRTISRQAVISMTQIVSVETEVDGPKKGEVKLDGEVTLDDETVFRNPQSGSDVDQFLRLRGVLRLIQFPKIISSLPGKHGDGRHFDIDVCDPRLDLLLDKEETEELLDV